MMSTVDNDITMTPRKAKRKNWEGREIAKAYELLAEGKRSLNCDDFTTAADHFSVCCELLAKHFDSMAFEMAEPSLLYGESLLEMARCNPALFGENNPMQINVEDNDDNSQESSDDEQEEEEKIEEGKSGDEPKEVDESFKTCPNESTLLETVAAEVIETPDNIADESDSTEEKPDNEETNEEKQSVLQLAWESLETARLIYESIPNNELRVADCRQKLGLVHWLNELFDDAFEEFRKSIEIQKKSLKSDDRRIASTYYELGLVQISATKFSDAADSFRQALEIMSEKIANLENDIKADDINEEDKQKLEKELVQIKLMVPDLEEKFNDCEQSNKVVTEHLKEIKEMTTSPSKQHPPCTTEQFDQNQKKGNDISHLVRKPIKRSLDTEVTSGPSKQSKVEENNGETVDAVINND